MKTLFLKYQKEVIFFLMIVLIGIVSFEVGILYAGDKQETASNGNVIVIEKPITSPSMVADTLSSSQDISSQVLGAETEIKTKSAQNCLFVGSKNSDKYHSPTCHWAERIKPENRVCFESVEDAINKGYEEGCIE